MSKAKTSPKNHAKPAKELPRKLSYPDNFYTVYRQTFDVIEADTDELRRQAFRLRYRIYCAENKFEDPERNPHRMERDIHDYDATHYLLIHKESQNAVGTVRIILPNDNEPEASFPMQKISDHPLLHMGDKPLTLCQISRLCMARRFRRRRKDGRVLPAYHPQENIKNPETTGKISYIRRRIPYAPLGLFAAAFETALKARIMDCVCMMEAAQLRNFRLMGIRYCVLGPRVSYHGGSQPVIFNIKNVLDNMLIDNPQCWDVAGDRGRIHKMANELYYNDWQDSIFGDNYCEMIYDRFGL